MDERMLASYHFLSAQIFDLIERTLEADGLLRTSGKYGFL